MLLSHGLIRCSPARPGPDHGITALGPVVSGHCVFRSQSDGSCQCCPEFRNVFVGEYIQGPRKGAKAVKKVCKNARSKTPVSFQPDLDSNQQIFKAGQLPHEEHKSSLERGHDHITDHSEQQVVPLRQAVAKPDSSYLHFPIQFRDLGHSKWWKS